ncbi:uncharacterized protein FPRO_11729 [Fusarium proliferatum ET1]|uniref:Uncharacterized protein n=1 Tax=Fusarium proliferatum (strain ET1) TaxID=1227346 RepID=A0A1L7W1G4_FUSPR|nr:uncharacterized protein FPRO_11729 [Fusarium proliferatum ET1]CZR46282.1 uncharacterized protein FPRO_11729 [Fusarium proliferatum ET1]
MHQSSLLKVPATLIAQTAGAVDTQPHSNRRYCEPLLLHDNLLGDISHKLDESI